MSDATPSRPAGGLCPVTVDDFLLPYLYTITASQSVGKLAQNLRSYVTKPQVERGLDSLVDRGMAAFDGKGFAITPAGRSLVETTYGGKITRKSKTKSKATEKNGIDATADKSSGGTDTWFWLALALGVDGPSARRQFAKIDGIRASAMTALFNLPLKRGGVSMAQVLAAITERAIAGQPVVAEIGGNTTELVGSLGKLTDRKPLEAALIRAALNLADPAVPSGDTGDLAGFAARVHAVTERLSSPPLSDAVAIAQVYDAYGRTHADAGGLEAFKARLVRAHADRLVSLATLDSPDALDRDLRLRSEIQGQHRRFHLILRRGA